MGKNISCKNFIIFCQWYFFHCHHFYLLPQSRFRPVDRQHFVEMSFCVKFTWVVFFCSGIISRIVCIKEIKRCVFSSFKQNMFSSIYFITRIIRTYVFALHAPNARFFKKKRTMLVGQTYSARLGEYTNCDHFSFDDKSIFRARRRIICSV